MKNILFFGCGKMGSAIALNFIENGEKVIAIKKTDKNQENKITYFKNTKDLPKNYKADFVFIAIKPQGSKKTLVEFAKSDIFHKNTIFVSVLAGKKLEFFEEIFGENSKIIRSMPNMAVKYSQGIFAYIANKNINATNLKSFVKLTKNLGTTIETQRQEDLHVLSAAFGSGPAYVFYIQEVICEILEKLSFSKELAFELTNQLFYGSILTAFDGDSFENLQKSIASKGGTTQAALDELKKDDKIKGIFKDAINAAIKRSKELSDV